MANGESGPGRVKGELSRGADANLIARHAETQCLMEADVSGKGKKDEVVGLSRGEGRFPHTLVNKMIPEGRRKSQKPKKNPTKSEKTFWKKQGPRDGRGKG